MNLRHLKSTVCGVVTAGILFAGGNLYALALLLSDPAPFTNGLWNTSRTDLGYKVWTEYTALTNGRQDTLYAAPWYSAFSTNNLVWNTNCLLWGVTGETALTGWFFSPNVPSGTIDVSHTAITQRHLYSRGHSAGAFGFYDYSTLSNYVVFVSPSNTLYFAHILYGWCGLGGTNYSEDWTVTVCDADLPAWVQPVGMIDNTAWQNKVAAEPKFNWPPPYMPMLGKCQHGYIGLTYGDGGPYGTCPSTLYYQTNGYWGSYPSVFNDHFPVNQGLLTNNGVAYVNYGTGLYISQDSGNPDFYVLNHKMWLYRGRSTQGFSTNLLAAMNYLSAVAGLNSNLYQPQMLDLNQYQ